MIGCFLPFLKSIEDHEKRVKNGSGPIIGQNSSANVCQNSSANICRLSGDVQPISKRGKTTNFVFLLSITSVANFSS